MTSSPTQTKGSPVTRRGEIVLVWKMYAVCLVWSGLVSESTKSVYVTGVRRRAEARGITVGWSVNHPGTIVISRRPPHDAALYAL